MLYKRFGNTYAVRIDKGEEVMAKLKELCRTESIRFAQVKAIGASEGAVLGVFELSKKEYNKKSYPDFCEITSLIGNITTVNDEPYIHLHATLADQQHNIHGGHVLEMTVGATCEMFVQIIDSKVGRLHDDQLGINLWDI